MGSLDRKVTFEDVIAKASEYLKKSKKHRPD